MADLGRELCRVGFGRFVWLRGVDRPKVEGTKIDSTKADGMRVVIEVVLTVLLLVAMMAFSGCKTEFDSLYLIR